MHSFVSDRQSYEGYGKPIFPKGAILFLFGQSCMKSGLRSGKYRGVHCPFLGKVPLRKVTPIIRQILIFLAIPAEHLIFDLRFICLYIRCLAEYLFCKNREKFSSFFVSAYNSFQGCSESFFSGAESEIHLWSVPPMPMGSILSYTSRNTGLGLLYFAFEGNVNPFTGGPFGHGNNVFPSEKPESRKYFIPLIKYAIIFYETSSGCPLPVHNGRVQE